MLLLIYVLVILAGAIYFAISEDKGLADSVLCFAWGFVGYILLMLPVTLLTSEAFNSLGSRVVTRHNEIRVASLKTDKDLHGSFFIGCGGIESDEIYYFMEDLGGGRFKRGTVKTQNCILHESPCESPKLSWDSSQKVLTERSRFWWPVVIFKDPQEESNYVLTVPNGTVIQKFEVR